MATLWTGAPRSLDRPVFVCWVHGPLGGPSARDGKQVCLPLPPPVPVSAPSSERNPLTINVKWLSSFWGLFSIPNLPHCRPSGAWTGTVHRVHFQELEGGGHENRPGSPLLHLCSLPSFAPPHGMSHLLLTRSPPSHHCWPVSSAFAFSNLFLRVPTMLPPEDLVPLQKPLFPRQAERGPFPDLAWGSGRWPIHSC